MSKAPDLFDGMPLMWNSPSSTYLLSSGHIMPLSICGLNCHSKWAVGRIGKLQSGRDSGWTLLSTSQYVVPRFSPSADAAIALKQYFNQSSVRHVPVCSLTLHHAPVKLIELQDIVKGILQNNKRCAFSSDAAKSERLMSLDIPIEPFDVQQFSDLGIAIGHAIEVLKLELHVAYRHPRPTLGITMSDLPELVNIVDARFPALRRLCLPIGGGVASTLQQDLSSWCGASPLENVKSRLSHLKLSFSDENLPRSPEYRSRDYLSFWPEYSRSPSVSSARSWPCSEITSTSAGNDPETSIRPRRRKITVCDDEFRDDPNGYIEMPGLDTLVVPLLLLARNWMPLCRPNIEVEFANSTEWNYDFLEKPARQLTEILRFLAKCVTLLSQSLNVFVGEG